MISWHDLYMVLTAVVPLYVAMILGYGSVRWWGIFTPDQCSGINRFVAIFLVPLLSFHFIYANDPYAMNFRFLAADTLQKLIILVALTVWSRLPSSCGGAALAPRLDWSITLFSVSTLPNTLVIGIPLLSALYGPYSGSLMVQVVVLQSLVWYTLLLFLFEFRAARMLIKDQFPAAAIASMRVDPDVVSLDGGRAEAEAEAAEDGRLHVTVRRSSASRRSQLSSGAEMHSASSSRQHSLRVFNNFNLADSSFGASEVYSMHSARSNFDVFTTGGAKEIQKVVPVVDLPLNCSAGKGKEVNRALSAAEREDLRFISSKTAADAEAGEAEPERPPKLGSSSTAELQSKRVDGADAVPARPHQTPAASVMTRVALVMVWRKLTRNPNTYASVIGLVWSLIAFRWHIFMPAIVAKSISILSDAGLGMAMYSLGLSTALQPRIIACGYRAAGYSMAVRFLAAPVITAAASLAVGLRGTLLHITILQAALPQGIVPFVFAKEYSLHPALLSTSVIFGLAIAVPIVLVYYIILGLIK